MPLTSVRLKPGVNTKEGSETIMLTQQRVCELLSYDPDTGIIRWRCRRGVKKAGDVASYGGAAGYLYTRIDGKLYRVSRLIWLMQTGNWPVNYIDHINGIRNDDHWLNLREATPSQNCANSIHKGSFSGLKGAHYRPKRKGRNKWTSTIVKNRKLIYLGAFATKEEAHSAYAIAAAALHGEFTRLR